MFGKKKPKQPKIYIGGFKENFDDALFAIQNGLAMEKDITGKIACLDFALKVLQTDLKHSILSEVEKMKFELRHELETGYIKPGRRCAIPDAWRFFICSKWIDVY
jgi:hypothetical protein